MAFGRRRRGYSTQKRKIERDHAILRGDLVFGGTPDNQILWDWARVPAQHIDTLQDNILVPTNNTLVDTRALYDWQVGINFDGAGSCAVFINEGLIAVPGYAGDALPLETFDPAESTPSWIWRHHEFRYYQVSGAVFVTDRGHNQQGAFEFANSRAQRRLPDNIGLLHVWSVTTLPGGGSVVSVGYTGVIDYTMTMKCP